jgi:hypothetical protein
MRKDTVGHRAPKGNGNSVPPAATILELAQQTGHGFIPPDRCSLGLLCALVQWGEDKVRQQLRENAVPVKRYGEQIFVSLEDFWSAGQYVPADQIPKTPHGGARKKTE